MTYTLSQLGDVLKMSIKSVFSEPVWVRGELSELRESVSGHCFVELTEKSSRNDSIVAKMRGNIWSSTYALLKPYFESTAGMPLAVGMNVLMLCQVDFHELYGVSLTIRDIDPSFTVGEMALKRQQIVRQLTDEGVIDMNKSLPLPLVPKRVAVVSSATAAGYGDFCDQLRNNDFGYQFDIKLYQAAMQGEQTEQSIVAALDKIFDYAEQTDIVVIIRGGGATSDLVWFDNYNLALHCAQFPLPIVSGIGHQRDESVIDLVANTAVKTPTAAAEFLIDLVQNYEQSLDEAAETIAETTRQMQHDCESKIQNLTNRLFAARHAVFGHQTDLQSHVAVLSKATKTALLSAENRLALLEKSVEYSNPETLLKRGYSITTKFGKIVRNAVDLQPNDSIETHFADGKVKSVVCNAENQNLIEK